MNLNGCLEPNIDVSPPSFPVITLYDKEKPFLSLEPKREVNYQQNSNLDSKLLQNYCEFPKDVSKITEVSYSTILPKIPEPQEITQRRPILKSLTPMYSIRVSTSIKSKPFNHSFEFDY